MPEVMPGILMLAAEQTGAVDGWVMYCLREAAGWAGVEGLQRQDIVGICFCNLCTALGMMPVRNPAGSWNGWGFEEQTFCELRWMDRGTVLGYSGVELGIRSKKSLLWVGGRRGW